MKLYFIAILPNADLRNRIRKIKEEIAENYNARHALKLPAHITLQIPFKYSEEEEGSLMKELKSFAVKEPAFSVQLSGFGAFPPRVIYISVGNPEPVDQLYLRLQNLMANFTSKKKRKSDSAFHPHVTVATRDLGRESFESAWEEFQKRDFHGSFYVDRLVLFKHNGKTWDIHSEFSMAPEDVDKD